MVSGMLPTTMTLSMFMLSMHVLSMVVTLCSALPHVEKHVQDKGNMAIQKIDKRRVAENVCRTELVSTELQFEESRESETGQQQLLVCRGHILVSKCEGSCLSSVSPSVNHWEGFHRICTCCKEGWSSSREVTLTDCYIDSHPVNGEITRAIKEPKDCSCQQCRN